MIECYYDACPKHEVNCDPDSGPFCAEPECTATESDLEEYRKIRLNYLRKNCNIKELKC